MLVVIAQIQCFLSFRVTNITLKIKKTNKVVHSANISNELKKSFFMKTRPWLT